MQIICEYCGAKRSKPHNQVMKHKHHFCDIKCYNFWRKTHRFKGLGACQKPDSQYAELKKISVLRTDLIEQLKEQFGDWNEM